MKRLLCFLLSVLLLTGMFSLFPSADEETLTVLFTHDIHDYYYPTATMEESGLVEHGGSGRLATLLKQNKGENTVYLDAGDFSMGTLYQAAFSTDAFELRTLGILDCKVTTFGNHEFDYGCDGLADMLNSAKNSGDVLPELVLSNLYFSDTLTEDQQKLKDAWENYGGKKYTLLDVNGITMGVFALEGISSISYIQTSVDFTDYIECAKEMVAELEDKCDIIVCLSHSGTDGNGETGEDIDLANEVEGIDLIISAHTHTTYEEPVKIKDTYIVSCGCYLKNLGKITLKREGDGWTLDEYALLRLDNSVESDEETDLRMEGYKKTIEDTYLAPYGLKFDDVICHSSFNSISLDEMYATHGEYAVGNLIADSYLYEAEQNGIEDIDVALVGLGTIRGSVKEGDITVADAFEICSLGVGADGSAGHPIISAYITGKELKLLCELDASLGTLVSSIKMSYAGLRYTFNTKRVILERVTEVYLVKDGKDIPVEDDQLYRICANMYAANMLGMLNGLTKGILSITPKDKDGNVVENFYDFSLKDTNGLEIKEWVAFCHYLSSFEPNEEGVSELPSVYADTQGRKVKISDGSLLAISKPGNATHIILYVVNFVYALIALITFIVVRKHKKNKSEKNKSKKKPRNGVKK